MSKDRNNIIGIGCDFQTEPEEDNRKLAIESLSGGEKDRIKWMLSNMKKNKAYTYKIFNKLDQKDQILNYLKDTYLSYRDNWKKQPQRFFDDKLKKDNLKDQNFKPLCFDIEVAAVCDLACSFCYRQFISTPDKIMSKELAFKLIDQASELHIPSIKFNWRGEPLLNPKLPEIIDHAKKKGILETIINTNATRLDERMSEKIIKSGLDIMIYSFDGGTKETYEKMRPGRFEKNKFENIYENIKRFSEIRSKLKSPFPRTKIQMILTDETRKVKEEYFNLFKDIVDDVSVKQYTERGGNLSDLNENFDSKFKNNKTQLQKQFGDSAAVMKDSKDNYYISEKRLPCEQPFQRVLTTYDGKVGMCCYDWGATHTVGYLDKSGISNGDKEYLKVKKQAEIKKKGFEMMNLKMPKKYNTPSKIVKNLKDIWYGNEINKVREAHINGKVEKINICKKCPFKETYKWVKIS